MEGFYGRKNCWKNRIDQLIEKAASQTKKRQEKADSGRADRKVLMEEFGIHSQLKEDQGMEKAKVLFP